MILPVANTTVPVSLDSQRKNTGVYVPLVSLVNTVRMVSCSWKLNQMIVNRNQGSFGPFMSFPTAVYEMLFVPVADVLRFCFPVSLN